MRLRTFRIATAITKKQKITPTNIHFPQRRITYFALSCQSRWMDASPLDRAARLKGGVHRCNVTVTESSWAAEKLTANGEKLEKGPEMSEILLTEALFDNPSEKVKKLTDEVLALNVIEVNQLLRRLQVRNKSGA